MLEVSIKSNHESNYNLKNSEEFSRSELNTLEYSLNKVMFKLYNPGSHETKAANPSKMSISKFIFVLETQ